MLEMRAAGLLVTINTDDPAMEDLDLGQEYRNVATAYGLSVEDMAQMAIDGIESTWLDGSERAVLAHEFRQAPAGLGGGSAAR